MLHRDKLSSVLLQGGGMDAYAKQWRLFADILNNGGVPLFKSFGPNVTAIAEEL